MSNKTYDLLKKIALFGTPILTLLATLMPIWNVPYGKALAASFAAIDTCLGAIVLVAKKLYDEKQNKQEDKES